MAKAKKKDILSYDVVAKKAYRLSDNILSEETSSFNADYVISYAPATEVKYAIISSSSDDGGGDEEQVANKAYEELDLDLETDYQIRYAISDAALGVENSYNVLAIETKTLEREFKDAAARTNYFDYIDFEPTMYSAYYSSNIFSGAGVDMYLYLHKTYATFTVYKDGGLCAFRLLNKLSIDALHAAFCHELAERIPEHVFIEEFNQYGLDNPDSNKRVALNKVFADSCMLLANNINFLTRQLRIENDSISNVAVAMDAGNHDNIMKKVRVLFAHFRNMDADMLLEAMLENSTSSSHDGLSVNNFVNLHQIKCDMFKNGKNFLDENGVSTISPIVMMMLLRASEQLKESNDIFNVSIFLRPPPLHKRQSGQLILAAIAALVVSGIYPGYNMAQGYLTSMEKDDLQEQIPDRRKVHNALKEKIDQLKDEVKTTARRIDEKKQKLAVRSGLLDRLFDKKVNYMSKAQALANVTKIMNASGVHVRQVELTEEDLSLHLVGSNVAVTKFIRDLGANRDYVIESKELNIAKESDGFNSKLEVRIKR